LPYTDAHWSEDDEDYMPPKYRWLPKKLSSLDDLKVGDIFYYSDYDGTYAQLESKATYDGKTVMNWAQGQFNKYFSGDSY
jgi:hypothetical protein